jgi:hypothetical protein
MADSRMLELALTRPPMGCSTPGAIPPEASAGSLAAAPEAAHCVLGKMFLRREGCGACSGPARPA